MKTNVVGLVFGSATGFVFAWAGLADPKVIRDMLLLRQAHVYLLMGSAVMVAAGGVRVLRAARARAFLTGESIAWSTERPTARHVVGSVLFGVGWSVVGTCPGPAAVMLGQGRATGLVVALGIVIGVLVQRAFVDRRSAVASADPAAGAAGL